MTLWDYAKAETAKMMACSTAVDPAIIEKYKKDLAADYQKYVIESRIRRARTRQISDRTFIV